MKTKLLVFSIAFFSYFTIQAQDRYSFTLIQNSDYNYSVAAVPNFVGNVANPPNLESFGFTVMLQDGASASNITLGYLNLDSATVIPASNLDAFDPGYDRSATLIASTSGDADLPAHNIGDIIVLATFDVLGTPTTGEISILDNNSALATSTEAGGALNSYFSADPTGGFSPTDVYGGQTGTTSFSFTTLSINELNELESNISIYPSPTHEYINISSSLTLSKVELYNLLGKRVLDTVETSQIKINHLQTGIYLVKVYTETGTLSKKIIIE